MEVETFKNKTPKVWNNNFSEIESEIGFEVSAYFLGFSREFSKLRIISEWKRVRMESRYSRDEQRPNRTGTVPRKRWIQGRQGDSTWPPAPSRFLAKQGRSFPRNLSTCWIAFRQSCRHLRTCRHLWFPFGKPVDMLFRLHNTCVSGIPFSTYTETRVIPISVWIPKYSISTNIYS